MEICGDKWKSSDDMKAVLSRPSLASRFSFGERFPWWLHATTFSPRKRTTEGAAMESKPPLNKDGMVAYTSFSSMFYPGRAKVLAEEWPMVESALGEYGMSCKLDWDGRFITVATTTRTRGADIVYKARDLLHLLALTNVPPSMAIQILDGRLHCDIIWTANCYGGLLSKLSFKSKGQYFTRMKNIRRNVEGLVSVSGCSLFINGFSVTAISAIPEGLLTIRGIVTSCIVKGQNPGTAVRLLKLFQERNGQTENLEMDAYGFKTAPGAKLRFLKRLGGNPLVEQKNSELTLTRGDDVGELKPSIGNPRVEHKKSEDDPTPEVNHTEFSLFGPSLNKDGMLVCGSFFLDHREDRSRSRSLATVEVAFRRLWHFMYNVSG
ncbi:uncharacterized protein LOC133745777 isoform X1 [Rosa rugosa]|uniref:uncharacterized protein LOC133745777 isoform X1 n=1 Tax=Rosa rugosa TaxID=74645 RepID=UPI002B418580|nr:uncharacterized protein LOC133745777 isoform X1 [Rosa rugosa]